MAARFAKPQGAGLFIGWGGTEAFRLSLRKPFGFADENGVPNRCFRKSRRHPRAQSKLSWQRER